MKSARPHHTRVFPVAAIVFAVTLLLTYMVGILALRCTQKVDAERTVVQHLEELSSSFNDAESAQRGYLLTTNDIYLQTFRQETIRTRVKMAVLRSDAAAGAFPSESLEIVLNGVEQRQTEMAQALQVRRKSGLEAILKRIRAGNGQLGSDVISEQIEKLKVVVMADLAQAMGRARTADFARAATFTFTIIVNLAFLAWADRRVAVTSRAQAAAMLETTRQKELLGTTLASIGDGVIVTDVQERITFLNPEAVRLTGWSLQDAVGQPISNVFRIVNASTREKVESPVQKALRTGLTTGLANHTILLSKTGAEFPIDDSAASIRPPDGPPFGVVLVFRDWTNQRRAEETRARLAAIVESSGDAIISKNLDGIIQTWNGGAERLFGYKPEEIIGKPVTTLIPADRLAEEDFILGRIREGKKVEWTEAVRLAKDGRRIPVALSVSPVNDESGQAIGASSILHDATEIVAARETLARGREELERLVKERTGKLQEIVNELQHVSYSITHDMRAPLRAMSAFAEILLDQTSPYKPSPEEAQDYCRRIVRAARRLDQLIMDALSYTKVVLQEVPQDPVDLDKIVRDLIDVYPHLQPDRADIQVDGTLPAVLGNESYLTQCFSNLLGNAVKFVAPNVRPRIRLRAQIKGKKARIWVEDNGIGIPHAAQKRLFGMYEKLDDRYEGTGIGLAIVRKLVERMGGAVGVDSEPGQGSHFWVDLRLAV
jgi:PAS domain S-box-containing protein